MAASSTLSATLDRLAQIDGFHGAAIVSADGEPMATAKGDGWDVEQTSALVCNFFAAARKLSTELQWGSVLQLDLAASNGSVVYLRPHSAAGIEFMLLLVCKAEASKALVRLRMDQTIPEIATALSNA